MEDIRSSQFCCSIDDVIKELQEILNRLRAAESELCDQTPHDVEPTMTTERLRDAITQHYLNFLNTADREQLKAVKFIGDKQVDWILELREESAQAFKSREDLKKIELSDEEIKNMLKNWAAQLFD